MPEGDRFEPFRVGWRSAYNHAIDAGASLEEMGDKLSKTLAEKLRETGGVPRMPEMTERVIESNQGSLLRQYEALDRLVREQKGHIHTNVAAGVAKAMAIQSTSVGFGLDGDLPRQFAQRICQAIVDNGFFAKAGTRLVEEGRFANIQDFREWQRSVERTMAPSIEKIADHLIAKPDAEGLRAPNRISKQRTTSEILGENLL